MGLSIFIYAIWSWAVIRWVAKNEGINVQMQPFRPQSHSEDSCRRFEYGA